MPGAPGRIVWSYPLEAYVEDKEFLNGLEFKGLFAARYTITPGGALRYADIAVSGGDFQQSTSTPWHERVFA